jgi:hypothetical protein
MHMNFIIKNISFDFTDLGYYMDYTYLVLKNIENIVNIFFTRLNSICLFTTFVSKTVRCVY